MKKLLIAAALAALTFSAQAASRQVKWGTVGGWEVTAYPDTTQCIGSAYYPASGTMLSVGLTGTDIWAIGINAESYTGQIFNVYVEDSHGSYGKIIGTGIGNNLVLFDQLTWLMINNIARARWVYFDGLGRFNLNGSRAAINQVIRCVGALRGED